MLGKLEPVIAGTSSCCGLFLFLGRFGGAGHGGSARSRPEPRTRSVRE